MKPKLIPRHYKGNPINTNPLPKMPVNNNPVPGKKDDKKKLIEIDQRVAGNIPPPAYPIDPRGSGKGYYMIKRNEQINIKKN